MWLDAPRSCPAIDVNKSEESEGVCALAIRQGNLGVCMFDQRSTVLRHSMDERRNVSDARCSRCVTRVAGKRKTRWYSEPGGIAGLVRRCECRWTAGPDRVVPVAARKMDCRNKTTKRRRQLCEYRTPPPTTTTRDAQDVLGEVCGVDLLHVRHRTLNAQRGEQRVPLLLRLRWRVARGVSLRSSCGGL